MSKLAGYRDYYYYTLWGDVTKAFKYRYLVKHALGLTACYKKGKLGSYCPCYWNGVK
jgi:hypothetical protein